MAHAWMAAALLALVAIARAEDCTIKSKVVISELADPGSTSDASINAASARYVEIYNGGDRDFDLTNDNGAAWALQYFKAASPTASVSIKLEGFIMARGFLILCNDKFVFEAVYGVACDQETGVKLSNGDDQYGLARDGVVVDMFGVVGENGKDTAHFFQDGRAERKKDVAQAKCVWSAADWDVDSKKTTSAPALGDGALEAPSGYDAAVWLGRDPFIIATTTTTTSTTTTTVRAATDATTIATTVADTTTIASTVADTTTVATTVADATTVATTVADATTVAAASTPTAVVTQVATTASAGRVVTVATAAPPSTSGESQARIDVANATTTATAAATTVGQDINREPGATTEGQESNRGPAGKESKAKKAKKGGADSLKKESQSSGAQAKGGKGKGKGGKGKGGQGDGAFEARAANATGAGAEAKATLGGPQPKGKGKEPKSPKKVKVGKMLQGPELRATSRGRNIVPDINTGLLSLAAVFVVAAAVVVVAGFKFAAKSSPDTPLVERQQLERLMSNGQCNYAAVLDTDAAVVYKVRKPGSSRLFGTNDVHVGGLLD